MFTFLTGGILHAREMGVAQLEGQVCVKVEGNIALRCVVSGATPTL